MKGPRCACSAPLWAPRGWCGWRQEVFLHQASEASTDHILS